MPSIEMKVWAAVIFPLSASYATRSIEIQVVEPECTETVLIGPGHDSMYEFVSIPWQPSDFAGYVMNDDGEFSLLTDDGLASFSLEPGDEWISITSGLIISRFGEFFHVNIV